MTDDDRLRADLEGLEVSAPTGVPPDLERGRRPGWVRVVLAGTTAMVAILVTSLGIAELAGDQPGVPTIGATSPPVTAETQVGDFILSISSPQTVWQSGESIEVVAQLSYEGDAQGVSIGQGVPPIQIQLVDLSGSGLRMGGTAFRPCIRYPISENSPIIERFQKGAWFTQRGMTLEDPPFDRELLDGPDLRLPAGKWMFIASTAFGRGNGECGDEIQIQASVVVRVVAPGESPLPIESVAENPDLSPPAVSRTVCRDSVIDRVYGYATQNEIEDDVTVIEAALEDEPTFGGVYISDEQGARSRLESVLLTTSCDIERIVPDIGHPDRLRIELVRHSLADLGEVNDAISQAFVDRDSITKDIGQVSLDVSNNQVRVTYIDGTESGEIVVAGGVPPAFAADSGPRASSST